MWCNQIFSLIQDRVVQNIIVSDNYEVANQLARGAYGESAIAVDTTLYPVSIGDIYENGTFKDINGNVVEKNPTESDRVTLLEAANTKLKADVDFLAMSADVVL